MAESIVERPARGKKRCSNDGVSSILSASIPNIPKRPFPAFTSFFVRHGVSWLRLVIQPGVMRFHGGRSERGRSSDDGGGVDDSIFAAAIPCASQNARRLTRSGGGDVGVGLRRRRVWRTRIELGGRNPLLQMLLMPSITILENVKKKDFR